MKRMRNLGQLGPVARATGIVAAVAIIISGVTFATLQSQQAVLTGNTIQSATADLKIGISTSSFSASRAGFTFSDVIPGTAPAANTGNIFYLKNGGSAPMTIKATIGSTPTNTSNIDLSKVSFIITRVDTNKVQTATLKELIDGYPSNGVALQDKVDPSNAAQYKIQASMASDAFTGSSANLGNIDLVFTGVM
jgi:hypothetical protein